MANMIARLGVALGLDTAEFNKGIEAAGKKLEQFSQTAEKFGKIGATALVAASAAALKYADELADVAEANEVAIGTVLKLSDALANSGGKADNAGKMLSAFAKFIDEAASGSDKAQKTAQNLGVSLKDLGTLSQEELLNKVVANLGKIEDPVTRNAKAMEIFSKAAKGVDMQGFADKMSQVNPLIEEQEKAIKAAADTYDLFAQTSRDVMVILGTELGPILKATVDYMKTLGDQGVSLSGIFRTVFQTVTVLGSEIGWFFKTIFDEIGHTYNNAVTLITKGKDAAIKANEEYNAKVKTSRQNLDFYQDQVMGVSTGRSSVDERRTDNKKPSGGKGGRVVSESKEAEKERKRQMQIYAQGAANAQKSAEEDAKARAEFFAMYDKGNAAVAERQRLMGIALDSEKELMQLEMKSSGMRQEDYALEREQLLIRQQLERNLEEIGSRRDLTATARLEAETRENALAEKSLAIAREKHRLTKGLREGTYEEGVTKRMGEFLRNLPTDLEMGEKAFDSLMGNMGSAIDNFVRTGKLSFKDLARSIIQDILAMQMKAMAFRLLGSLFGGGNQMAGASVLGMPGYADGGNPSVGQPSIVGERGPEIFVPRTAGTIIPNHALSGMGGTTNVTNNYINAIDTKSFEDRLLGSSNAVWAANQYAGKNMPTNFGRT